jgi:hypothetical protein
MEVQMADCVSLTARQSVVAPRLVECPAHLAVRGANGKDAPVIEGTMGGNPSASARVMFVPGDFI